MAPISLSVHFQVQASQKKGTVSRASGYLVYPAGALWQEGFLILLVL